MKKMLACLVTAITAPALVMLAPVARAKGAPPAAQDEGAGRGSRLHVSTRIVDRTLVGFPGGKRKPQPGGNCSWLSPPSPERVREEGGPGSDPRRGEWSYVMDMHAENFEEVCRVPGLEEVEIERVGKGRCPVVDRRIAGEWLRVGPCSTCASAGLCEEVLAGHPKAFREVTRRVGSRPRS